MDDSGKRLVNFNKEGMSYERYRIWEGLYSTLAKNDASGYHELVRIFWNKNYTYSEGEYEHRAESIRAIAAEVLDDF
jgi:hypothetical protein